jgi:c-di-GMP-binding flagellar brake protein YcgR
MPIRAMRPQEVIIVKDKGLQLIGLIAVHIEFIVTTERIVIQPIQWLEKTLFGAKSISLEYLDIEDVSIKGINQTLNIKVHGIEYLFLGEGSRRILSSLPNTKLLSSVNQTNYVPTPILFKSDTSILLSRGLSIAGKLQITTTDIHVSKKPSLENRLISSKHFFSWWADIDEFNYSNINRVLTIRADENKITFYGREALLCSFILEMLKEGEQLYETIDEINLLYNSLLTIPCFLFLGKEYTYYVPYGRLEEIFKQDALKKPNSSLSKMTLHNWASSRITMSFSDEEIVFDIPYPKMWIQYYQKSLFSLYKETPFELPPLPEKQEDIVFSCYSMYKKHKEKDSLYLGQIVLTRSYLAFYPMHKDKLLHYKLKEIQQVEYKRSKLFILHKGQIVEFQIPDPNNLQQYRNRIYNCLPPAEIREARGNQSIERILGESENIIILREGTPIIKCYNQSVGMNRSSIQVFTGKPSEKEYLKKGEILEIDLAKPEGRFRFKSHVKNDYYNKSDPIGRYYLGFEIPDNIFIYNKRETFRVPYHQETIIEKLIGFGYQKENIPAFIQNISVAGCRISCVLPFSFEQIEHEMIFYFSISFLEEKLSFEGKLLNIQEGEKENELLFGLQFINLPRNIEEKLLTKVLQIERELLREKSKPD